MSSVGGCNTIQMLRAEENKVIQTLVAKRSNEPLDVSSAIGRPSWSANDLDPLFGQVLVKAFCEFGIPVMLDESYFQPRVACLPYERLGLSIDPARIGMQSGWREND